MMFGSVEANGSLMSAETRPSSIAASEMMVATVAHAGSWSRRRGSGISVEQPDERRPRVGALVKVTSSRARDRVIDSLSLRQSVDGDLVIGLNVRREGKRYPRSVGSFDRNERSRHLLLRLLAAGNQFLELLEAHVLLAVRIADVADVLRRAKPIALNSSTWALFKNGSVSSGVPSTGFVLVC
jgi:hypothetical protein